MGNMLDADRFAGILVQLDTAQAYEQAHPYVINPRYVEQRPKENPNGPTPVTDAHCAYVRIGVECVDAYLRGKTPFPVESNPTYLAAVAAYDAVYRTNEYSSIAF
jgi:hypothetical protein